MRITEIGRVLEKLKEKNAITYCSHCGRGNHFTEWEYIDYKVNDYGHGIEEEHPIMQCPNCKKTMIF